MKRVAQTIAVLLLVFSCGIVLGASHHGNYKGYPIVKLIVNGSEVKNDVPAINFNGVTLVPLRIISETLGVPVNWDSKQYAAIIGNNSTDDNLDVEKLRALKIPGSQLTLGGRIHNLQIEVYIRKMGSQSVDEFKAKVKELMFPQESVLTLDGKQFQTIATLLIDDKITYDDAMNQLERLYNNWQQKIGQ